MAISPGRTRSGWRRCVEVMADSSVDAVWFARGGYGSNRIAEAAVRASARSGRRKAYLGYSDAGFLLAAFHKAGLEVAHGPMPQDVLRDGGEAAVDARARLYCAAQRLSAGDWTSTDRRWPST